MPNNIFKNITASIFCNTKKITSVINFFRNTEPAHADVLMTIMTLQHQTNGFLLFCELEDHGYNHRLTSLGKKKCFLWFILTLLKFKFRYCINTMVRFSSKNHLGSMFLYFVGSRFQSILCLRFRNFLIFRLWIIEVPDYQIIWF